MVLRKRPGTSSSIRSVVNDNGQTLGVVGKVEDLLEANFLMECRAPGCLWVFAPTVEQFTVHFGVTREEALEELEENEKHE